jgi:hypothetical protein
MGTQLYLLAHLFAAMLLVGVVFGALAAPNPDERRRTMMFSGILGLVVFVTGFGLLSRGGFGFQGWVVVKLGCWLGLAALPGLAFRRPEQIHLLRLLTVGAVFLAVGMAVLKPF